MQKGLDGGDFQGTESLPRRGEEVRTGEWCEKAKKTGHLKKLKAEQQTV